MRKWIGAICVFLGVICLLGAMGFVVYNRWEDKQAERIAQDILEDVQSMIETTQPELPPEEPVVPPVDTEPIPLEMATVEVDGYDCIGVLSIPVLNMKLPVLTEWSYEKLKNAPCHYYGTYYEKDFVIAGHNYESHFGKISLLQAGDVVIFTDVNGVDHCYEVVLLETLPREATLEMITSGFDLSLYTCTPDATARTTVRCSFIPGA